MKTGLPEAKASQKISRETFRIVSESRLGAADFSEVLVPQKNPGRNFRSERGIVTHVDAPRTSDHPSCLVAARWPCNAFPRPGKVAEWEEIRLSFHVGAGEVGVLLEDAYVLGTPYSRVAWGRRSGWLVSYILEEL